MAESKQQKLTPSIANGAGASVKAYFDEIVEHRTETKAYNERRAARTAAMREALTVVWEAFAAGLSVNGHTSKEAWAKWANPTAKYPLRNFEKILNPPPKTNSVRIVKLEAGMIVSVGGKKLSLTPEVLENIAAMCEVIKPAPKPKRWYKVGDDSKSLGIGSKNDLRAQGKRRHDLPATTKIDTAKRALQVASDEHDAEQSELTEPAKALAATVHSAAVPQVCDTSKEML